MTLARVKDGEVVQIGMPESLAEESGEKMRRMGWRPVKGTPKPTDGHVYEYTAPYSYNVDEDVVYGTWQVSDVQQRIKQRARDKAALTRAEFKLALLDRGELAKVKAAMEDPAVDPRAKILWEDALHFERMNDDLLALANEMGYTDAVLDEIFGV